MAIWKNLFVLLTFFLPIEQGFSKDIELYTRQAIRVDGDRYIYKFPLSKKVAGKVHYTYKFVFDKKDIKHERPLNISYLFLGKPSSGFNVLNAAEVSFRYNAEGNPVEKKSFNPEKKQISKKVYTYKKKLLTQEKVYDAKNKLSDIIKYKYDKRGNKLERAFYNAKGKLANNRLGYARRTFTYNRENLPEHESVYTASGSVMRKMDYQYNDKNQLLETVIRDNSGQVTERIQYKYDSKGNASEKTTLNNFKYIKQRILYKYDEQGNCTEERTLDANNSLLGDMFDVAIVKRKYGKEGNILEEKRYSAQNTLKSHVWYDDFEQLTKREEYNREQQLSLIIERDYDVYGNLLEESTYNITKRNKKKITVERKIYKNGLIATIEAFDKFGHIEQMKSYKNGEPQKTQYFNRQGKMIKEKMAN